MNVRTLPANQPHRQQMDRNPSRPTWQRPSHLRRQGEILIVLAVLAGERREMGNEIIRCRGVSFSFSFLFVSLLFGAFRPNVRFGGRTPS